MVLHSLLRGILIGLSIAAPVGPIGVLCIRRTLAHNRATGLASGLGAASADAVYGLVAGFGLSFVSDVLIQQQTWLRLIGGAFLCYLGVRTVLARMAEEAIAPQGRGLLGAYGSTFLLTLTNPVTILSFAAIFAGLGLAEIKGGYLTASVLVTGVFLGSALWWLLLTTGFSLFRKHITRETLRWVNRISGVVILIFGITALISGLSK